MTGQQLKNSILQMAVQGKLVPQDPNEEPASVLLERIRKEKERLIKEEKIKRDKHYSFIFKKDNSFYEKTGEKVVCIDDELPFEIPENWQWVTLKMIAVTELGKTLDKSKNQGDYKPYLCSINVYWSGINLTTVKEARFEESEFPKYKLKKGDLLICEGGDVGRSAIWENEQEMYYQNALHRVRFYGGINPHYFRLLMECYKSNNILDEQSKGITIKHLVQSALNAIYFPLPPIQEQKRIVNKFQSLIPILEQYNTSEVKLSNLNTGFPNLLKKSILQEAFQGKLVPQDPNDEPASVLLERIRKEKEQLIKEGKIKKEKNPSYIFKGADNLPYEKVGENKPVCIADEVPFEIPESWEWVRLGSIGDWGSGATPSRSIPEYYGGNIPWLKTGDLNDGYIEHIPESISAFALEKTSVRLNPTGSVLIAMYGATIGKVGILTFPATTNQACCACFPIEIYNEYLFYFLMSQKVAFVKQGEGGAQPNISKEKIIATLMPLPPLAEQHRIVDKIKEVFCAKTCRQKL